MQRWKQGSDLAADGPCIGQITRSLHLVVFRRLLDLGSTPFSPVNIRPFNIGSRLRMRVRLEMDG
jgi:hypothetical protein